MSLSPRDAYDLLNAPEIENSNLRDEIKRLRAVLENPTDAMLDAGRECQIWATRSLIASRCHSSRHAIARRVLEPKP